jgi:ribosomal protein L40E
MPSNRPNLTLDEQSFQELLSAAFTIQEHNDYLRQAQPAQAEPEAHSEPEAQSVCQHCGAPKPTDASLCPNCGLDEFRPGERMQRKWASMWLMSQEQVLWPERSPETRDATQKDVLPRAAERTPLTHSVSDPGSSGLFDLPVPGAAAKKTIAQEETETIRDRVRGKSALDGLALDDSALDYRALDNQALDDPALDPPARAKAPAANEWTTAATKDLSPEDSYLAIRTFQLSASDESSATEAVTEATTDETTEATADPSDAATSSLMQRFADWRVTLRFHRADIYLGVAVLVAVIAVFWPVPGSPQPAALGPWDRFLVEIGIAEAPPPVIHLQGDPGAEVWVDTHSALYYCPGEEQYGKTADGRVTSQREAQMDRFEPAGRLACE